MKGHIIARIHHGPPLLHGDAPLRNWPTRDAVVLDEGANYSDTLEITVVHEIITLQFISDVDGYPAQRTTICWPKDKHAEVLAMMGRVE